LADRLAGAPVSLRERVMRSLGEERRMKSEESLQPFTLHSSLFTLSAELRAFAENLLAEAQSATPTRELALTLLAADALITFAVEAEAVSDS
jgi:hypothetical protein